MKKHKREETVSVSLPEEKSVPVGKIGGYSMLLFGEKKIGKTTLAAQFPDALFLMTEPGGHALRIYQKIINSWKEFKEYRKLLKGPEGKRFKTVVLDTMDGLYDMCFEYMCEHVLYIEHPTDEKDFGKSWQAIKKEFASEINHFLPSNSGRGLIGISHAHEKKIETLTSGDFDRIVPTLGKQASSYLEGVMDIIAFYGYDGSKRYLYLEGNELIDAGSRVKEHFISSDGSKIERVKMGHSPEQAYKNLIRAFNNEQEGSGGDMLETKRKAVARRRGED